MQPEVAFSVSAPSGGHGRCPLDSHPSGGASRQARGGLPGFLSIKWHVVFKMKAHRRPVPGCGSRAGQIKNALAHCSGSNHIRHSYRMGLATTTTAASGRCREELLGQRPAKRTCRPRHTRMLGAATRGTKKEPTGLFFAACGRPCSFDSSYGLHETATTLDIPGRWDPRTKQQPTGLIAYPAAQGRAVRFPYGSN